MTFAIYTKLSDSVWQHWQTAKDFANQKMVSLTNSAQSFGQSLQETATQTTDHTLDAVTQTFNQSWQTAEQFQSTTSKAVQTVLLNPTAGINSAFNDWLIQHPILWRLVQILDWSVNHPIISVVLLLLVISLIWSTVKAIMRLIEQASWSILQVPIKLIETVFKVGFFSLVKTFNLAFNKSNNHQVVADDSASPPQDYQSIYSGKQQRLAEIALRLEAIQQEQKELLQEASSLIAKGNIDIKIPGVIRNS